jgi:hypothetical protein
VLEHEDFRVLLKREDRAMRRAGRPALLIALVAAIVYVLMVEG